MLINCSFCPKGSLVTDDIKLITIKGHDYLVCYECALLKVRDIEKINQKLSILKADKL